MDANAENSFFTTTMNLIGTTSSLPFVRVNRDEFLREQFAGSPHLDKIIVNGPQSVFDVKYLRQKAGEVIKASTNSSAAMSFATGLPSNPVFMVAAGGTDAVQYFGFALNMSQKVAYLFGEDDLFTGDASKISEDAKMRIVSYLGVMFGAGSAAALIVATSKMAATKLGKTVAEKALTRTVWYPLTKRVAALIGLKITRRSVGTVVTKAVPVLGGVVSGAVTYATFKPMGNRLADTFVKIQTGDFDVDIILNDEFVASTDTDDL